MVFTKGEDLVKRTTIAVLHADDHGVVCVNEGTVKLDNVGRLAFMKDFQFSYDLVLNYCFRLDLNGFLSHCGLSWNMQNLRHATGVTGPQLLQVDDILAVELDGSRG